ncbi:hypothetical protein ACP4OV_011556 [Aristida adscensionis]
MAMENIAPYGEFFAILVNLESEDMAANAAAMDRAEALILGGMLPDPMLLQRLIAGLTANLSKLLDHEIAAKMRVRSTLIALEGAIKNKMDMDASPCRDAVYAIWSCFVHEAIPRIQHHGATVRDWACQEQFIALKVICFFFCHSPVNINDSRCVEAFASLLLSPYSKVLHACADALLSLPQLVPGFAYTVTRAFCNMLLALPPQSPICIPSVVLMLDRLKQSSPTMVDHPGSNDLAMVVIRLLGCRNLLVQKKVLNLAVSLLTQQNVNYVLRILQKQMDKADAPVEYRQMLEEAIRECHSAYPGRIMQLILDPKYLVFVECIEYIKDIIDHNPMLRQQLVTCLLRDLRHVKSSPVCAAAVWAISVCSLSLLETHRAFSAISRLFEYMLDQRDIEKHECTDYYGARKVDAQDEQQQPRLMEMEELLFMHIGLRRQADGSYTIASGSKSSTDAEDESLSVPPYLGSTDNLTFLMGVGDVILADFVQEIVSGLSETAEW